MRRREFITLIGSAATWPLAARAQQPAMPVIGFIAGSSPAALSQQVAAFREGLKEAGFIEGMNVAVEYRYGEGQLDRFPALASDLVRRANAGGMARDPRRPVARIHLLLAGVGGARPAPTADARRRPAAGLASGPATAWALRAVVDCQANTRTAGCSFRRCWPSSRA